MKTAKLHRRTFLGTIAGVGVTAGMLPFLPRSSRAAGDLPRRILLLYTPLGNFAPDWWPTGTENQWELGSSLTALAPYKEHLLFVDGLYKHGMQWDVDGGPGNEHTKGISMLWTGSRVEGEWNTGTSIDQTIANAVGQSTQYKSLELGFGTGGSWGGGRTIYAGPGQPLEPEENPRAAFDRLFGDFTDDPVEKAKLELVRARRMSVIDMVKTDLDTVKGKVGSSQRMAIEAHLEAIRNIETRVNAADLACTPPVPGEDISGGDWTEQGPEQIARHSDLIAAAFACDLTRVASLQLGHCNGAEILGINQHEQTHACADNPNDTAPHEKLRQIDGYFADRLAYLLGRLAATPEGEGSVLDNTLIVWGSDTQNRVGGTHEAERFPFLLAGGRNFAFNTGRYVRFNHPGADEPTWSDLSQWQHYQRLLVSICRSFGIPIDTYGDMDMGSGPLAML